LEGAEPVHILLGEVRYGFPKHVRPVPAVVSRAEFIQRVDDVGEAGARE
jgi:hypothetical protein